MVDTIMKGDEQGVEQHDLQSPQRFELIEAELIEIDRQAARRSPPPASACRMK